MKSLKLTKNLEIPEDRIELRNEQILDTHERWLRTFIAEKKVPIYLGDKVIVSDQLADNIRNPNAGRYGIVKNIEIGFQGAFNTDYLIYEILTRSDNIFQTQYYTLKRVEQRSGNKLVEKLLRDTNAEFEKLFTR